MVANQHECCLRNSRHVSVSRFAALAGSSKKLLVTKSIAARSKKLLAALGITTIVTRSY